MIESFKMRLIFGRKWILNHVVKKFGWIKVNIGEDMIMSCHVIGIHQYQYNIFSIDVFKYIWYTRNDKTKKKL